MIFFMGNSFESIVCCRSPTILILGVLVSLLLLQPVVVVVQQLVVVVVVSLNPASSFDFSPVDQI